MIEKKKRRAIVRLVISTLILSALISILVTGITKGTRFSFFNFNFGNSYAHADKYTAGDTSITIDKLDEIDINWISGSVQVELYDGNSIEIQETNSDRLSVEDKVHSYYDNGTLHIQFSESKHFNFHNTTLSKTLQIRIPKKLYLDSAGSLNKLKIDSVSADITVNGLAIKSCIADTVSGNISLNGSLEKLKLDSVSGNTQLTSSITPTDIDTDSVSGDVTITVPADSRFSIEHDSASGDLDNAFPTSHEHHENDWEFDSVSGDVTIGCLD